MTDLLTTSAQRAYRTCPRLYSLRYERCYRPAHVADPLAFGALGHRGLEAWWGAAMVATEGTCKACGGSGEGPMYVVQFPGGEPQCDPCSNCGPSAWWAAAAAEIAKERDPFQRARALSLMWGYHSRWSELTWQGEPMRVLAVEAEFRGPLLNPETGALSRTWERAGKLDAVVEVAGRVYVVEHKTTSEDIAPGGDYWQRLQIDAQVSNYVTGARLLGFDVAGVIYDVIRKPALKPLLATPAEARRYRKSDGALDARQRADDENPEAFYDRLNAAIGPDLAAYYARALVVRVAEEEREAEADLWQTGLQIRDARRLNVWPRNADACVRYGRRCEFFGVCTGVESLDDPTRFKRVESPHEELTMCRPTAAE